MTPTVQSSGVIALERFAWYCFIGMLALWRSSSGGGTLLFWAYLSPMLGGLLGRYSLQASVAGGASLLCAGYVAATLNRDPLPYSPWAAGLFKPCLSALLGSLFPVGAARTAAFWTVLGGDTGRIDAEHPVGGICHRYGWGHRVCRLRGALGVCLLLLAVSGRSSPHGRASRTWLLIWTQSQWGRPPCSASGRSSLRGLSAATNDACSLGSRRAAWTYPAVSTLNPVSCCPVSGLAARRPARGSRGRLTLGMLFSRQASGSSARIVAAISRSWYLQATVGEVLISTGPIWLARLSRDALQPSLRRSGSRPWHWRMVIRRPAPEAHLICASRRAMR